MMFWCWSQSGKCSHFVTAASRHYPHHHQGPDHLLTGDWGIVKPAPAPAPAPLQHKEADQCGQGRGPPTAIQLKKFNYSPCPATLEFSNCDIDVH